MSILELSNDILGVIFSYMWRNEAKGVILACKRFNEVIRSKRYFSQGWKTCHIMVQNIPLKYTDSSSVIFKTILDYDHLDTMEILLKRFKDTYKWLPIHNSFYGLTVQNDQLYFNEKADLVEELCNVKIIYCCRQTWEELRKEKKQMDHLYEKIERMF